MYMYMYVQRAPGRAEQEGRKEKTQTNAKIEEKLLKNTQQKIRLWHLWRGKSGGQEGQGG